MGFEEIARQIMNDPGISKTAKVLGSIRAIGKDVDVPGGFSAAQVLVEIHDDDDVRTQCWLALEQGALKYFWMTEVAKAIPKLWEGYHEDFPEVPKEDFYRDFGMGELLFYGAWRMYRSNQPDLARYALDRAKVYIPNFEGVLLLEHALSNEVRVPTLYRQGSKLSAGDAELDAILRQLIDPDLRWVR